MPTTDVPPRMSLRSKLKKGNASVRSEEVAAPDEVDDTMQDIIQTGLTYESATTSEVQQMDGTPVVNSSEVDDVMPTPVVISEHDTNRPNIAEALVAVDKEIPMDVNLADMPSNLPEPMDVVNLKLVVEIDPPTEGPRKEIPVEVPIPVPNLSPQKQQLLENRMIGSPPTSTVQESACPPEMPVPDKEKEMTKFINS